MVYSIKPRDPQPTKLSNPNISSENVAARDVEAQNRLEDDLGITIALRKGIKSCTKHPISNHLGYSRLSPYYKPFTVSLDSVAIPRDIYQALQDEKWKACLRRNESFGKE